MTPAERLISAMRAQRLSWVVLEPAKDGRAEKRVQITRPPESAMPDFLVKTEDGGYTLKAELRHVEAYTVGWEGITEADLVGPAGSSDPAAFAPALWSVVVADKLAWLQAVATAILEAIVKHREALEATPLMLAACSTRAKRPPRQSRRTPWRSGPGGCWPTAWAALTGPACPSSLRCSASTTLNLSSRGCR